MALLPAALAATALGAAALVGGIAATSNAAPASDPVAAVSAVSGLDTAATPTPPALGWRWFARLDATQRACMDKASISRPIGPRSDAEKAAIQEQLHAAAKTCGIEVPTGARKAKVQAWWNGLSSTQQQCLKKADLTRPVGPLSADQRKALRQQIVSAAKVCDVTLPKAGARATNQSPATPAPSTTS